MNFLLRKRSFTDGWLLAFVSSGNTLSDTTALMLHNGNLGRVHKTKDKVLPDGTYEQDRVLLDWTQTRSLCLTLGTCRESNIYPLSFWEITPLTIWLFEVRCQTAALYQLDDDSVVLKLGLDGILGGISRVSTYDGPNIGCQFLVASFTSPSLVDGLRTGPTVMQIKSSAMAALVL